MKRRGPTKLKFKTFIRHIKTAFQNVFRNGWMSIAAISAVAVGLMLVGIFVSLLANTNKIASDIENDVSVRVYIDLAAEEDDRQVLQDEIEALDEVESIEFSSRDQELENVIENYGEEMAMFRGDENPLRDVFIVSTTNPDQTAQVASAIQSMDNVHDVNYGGASADRLFNFMDRFRIVGLIGTIILVLISVFLISNTIRLTIFSRATEIEIMKLVGATNWFIRWPFIFEGSIIGIIGSIIPVAIISIAYNQIYGRLAGYLAGTSFSLIAPWPFLGWLSLALIVLGVLIGAIGSSLSIRRFLRI